MQSKANNILNEIKPNVWNAFLPLQVQNFMIFFFSIKWFFNQLCISRTKDHLSIKIYCYFYFWRNISMHLPTRRMGIFSNCIIIMNYEDGKIIHRNEKVKQSWFDLQFHIDERNKIHIQLRWKQQRLFCWQSLFFSRIISFYAGMYLGMIFEINSFLFGSHEI